MAYNNNTGNNTLYPRTFYALYIGLNNNGIVHLIFKLSTKQILNTMKYQTVSVPENLIKIINETDSFFTKIQFGHFYSDCFTDQDDHSDNNKDDGQTLWNDEDHFTDKSYDELDSSQQLDCMESNKIVH